MTALSAGVLLAAAALAGPSPSPSPAPTVDEIVARHVAARGGRAALAGLRTVRMAGRASAGPGREAIVRREIARPGRIRTELVYQGMTGVYAWDGTAGWRVSPLDGSLEAEPLPPDEAVGAADQADIEGPLVDWKLKGHTVELAGTETLPGGAAHVLKVTLKSGGVRRLWIDAATGHLVRMDSTRRHRGREVTLETTYGDYRSTSGITFPHAIESVVRGRPRRLRVVVEKVETNPALDESRFRMPPR